MTEQLFLGVATILMSGVLAGVVTFKLNATRADRDLKLRKLEAVHRALHRASNWAGSPLVHFATTAYDSDIPRDDDGIRAKEDFQTLVTLYFPDLEEYRRKLDAIHNDVTDIVTQQIRAKMRGDESVPLSKHNAIMDRIIALQRDFDAAVRELAQEIRPQRQRNRLRELRKAGEE